MAAFSIFGARRVRSVDLAGRRPPRQLEQRDGTPHVGVLDDVVAIEHRARLVTGQPHHH